MRTSAAQICLFVTALSVGCTGNTGTTPIAESKRDASQSEAQGPEAPEPEPVTVDDDSDRTNDPIPDGFPNDIYVADGSKVTQFKEIGGKQNLILDYPERDIDDFVKRYQDGMSQQGWTLVTSSELPIGTITNFSKDDRKCTISIGPPKDKVIKVAIVLSGD